MVFRPLTSVSSWEGFELQNNVRKVKGEIFKGEKKVFGSIQFPFF